MVHDFIQDFYLKFLALRVIELIKIIFDLLLFDFNHNFSLQMHYNIASFNQLIQK